MTDEKEERISAYMQSDPAHRLINISIKLIRVLIVGVIIFLIYYFRIYEIVDFLIYTNPIIFVIYTVVLTFGFSYIFEKIKLFVTGYKITYENNFMKSKEVTEIDERTKLIYNNLPAELWYKNELISSSQMCLDVAFKQFRNYEMLERTVLENKMLKDKMFIKSLSMIQVLENDVNEHTDLETIDELMKKEEKKEKEKEDEINEIRYRKLQVFDEKTENKE